MATGLFLLGRLQAFQHFRLTPGLLPEHRIRNVHLRVRPHLILRSFLGLAPAADLEAAIRMAPAADLEGTVPGFRGRVRPPRPSGWRGTDGERPRRRARAAPQEIPT